MDALVELSWRAYPSVALMLLGVAGFLRGALAIMRSWRGPLRNRPVEHMSGFRIAVIGLAIAGIGAAWMWQFVWLLALALIIGGEELLESSWALYALRRSRRALEQFAAARGQEGTHVHLARSR